MYSYSTWQPKQVSRVGNQSVISFFNLSNVRSAPETGLLSIHIKRLGLEHVVEEETTCHETIFASRCLAQHLGKVITVYNEILFPTTDENEQLADDGIFMGWILI